MKLNTTEKRFCQIYAETGDHRAAAAKTNIEDGRKLLERTEIRREITRWEKLNRSRQTQVTTGIARLAFGSVTDCVRLLFAEMPPAAEELERMDLFNISEIKRPKAGGLEIKFFDRLKALELLAAQSGEEQDALGGFLKALKD
ncbi:MAG: terminase small subunit [Oscillospiraceae bacterium]|nr:terminase small subunit [Oscillospiraceae bacterium]